MIRVLLPPGLQILAKVSGEVTFDLEGKVTQRAVIDALETRFPALRGTVREYASGRRRAYLRFYACEMDLSHEDPDAPLPLQVAAGMEPYIILGAISGG